MDHEIIIHLAHTFIASEKLEIDPMTGQNHKIIIYGEMLQILLFEQILKQDNDLV